MAVVTMKQLLGAGVHFGHQTRRWNPKMRRFILGERNGIYLIDLRQTMKGIEESYGYIRDLVAGGGTIFSSGTKKQTQGPVAVYADACGMPYVNERWLGGMLTNFQTVSTRVKRMKEFEAMQKAGDFDAMPKKEALRHTRELEKLQRNLGGIRSLDRLPDAIFVIDTKKEHIAVTEANKLGMPVVAVVDTNCDPDVITHVIPGNDDAIRSGALLCRVVADAVVEGRFIAQQRPAPPAAAAPAASAPIPPRAGLPPVRGRRLRPPEPEPAGARPTARPPPQPASAAAAVRRAAPRRHRGRRRPRPMRPPQPPQRRGPAAADGDPDSRQRRRAGRVADGAGPDHRGGLTRCPRIPPRTSRSSARLTGVGMLDAKNALDESDGDMDEAARLLREQGLASQAKRADRDASEGAVAIGRVGQRRLHRAAAVGDRLRGQVGRVRGPGHLPGRPGGRPRGGRHRRAQRRHRQHQDHPQGEHLGRQVVRIEAPAGGVVDSYLHLQAGRGVNAVVVALDGGTAELAHDIAAHIAFARPELHLPRRGPRRARWRPSGRRSRRSPATRASPMPRCPRSSRVSLSGWYKERVLLDQPYVKDEKQTIAKLLGSATVTQFAQVVVGD